MRRRGKGRKNKAGKEGRARLVRMGKSRGIRLPEAFLQEVERDDEVEVEFRDGEVVIRPVPRPRRGWEKHFAGMTARGDDRLLDSRTFSLTNWDEEKWVW